MATFYLIRHGQTEFNHERRMQGQVDSSLTELGRNQAAASADEIKDIDFTACYHSPLGRTIETAQILTRHHNDIDLIPYESIMEMNFGEWEGTRQKKEDNANIDKNSSEHKINLHQFWFAPDKFSGAPGGGENYTQLTDRVYKGIENIQHKHEEEESILLVSHNGAIRAFLNKCLNRDLKDFWEPPKTSPASISIVEWNKGEKPQVIKYSGHDMTIEN